MKKIGIDARLYFQTGVGVYIRNLLYFLSKINHNDITYYVYILKQDLSKIKLPNKFVIRPVSSKWHKLKEQTLFLKDILKDNLDLMHFTYFSYPILYPKKFIATVHDTTLFHHKTGKASTKSLFLYKLKYLVFRFVFKSQINKSDFIITPTYTVKQDIVKLFGKRFTNKISVTYEGISYEFFKKNLILKSNNKPLLNYFLYIGNFFPHKNIERLIRAYAQINTSYKLLLIGPNDYFSKRIDELIKKLNMNKNILILNNVKINELPYYYKNAKALIHPSLSEGFGLPFVEAYYFKCPILASNIKVFKEILGNNYISFDPYDITDIKNKIQNFIKKPLFIYNKNIISKLSFNKMAEQTQDIYIKVLNLSI